MDEVAGDVFRVTGLDAGQLGQQFAKIAQAAPWPTVHPSRSGTPTAECDMAVGVAAQVEAFWAVEDRQLRLPDE